MKRTSRVEVTKYSRRITIDIAGIAPIADDLLAAAAASTFDDRGITIKAREIRPSQESRAGFKSRLRKLLRM